MYDAIGYHIYFLSISSLHILPFLPQHLEVAKNTDTDNLISQYIFRQIGQIVAVCLYISQDACHHRGGSKLNYCMPLNIFNGCGTYVCVSTPSHNVTKAHELLCLCSNIGYIDCLHLHKCSVNFSRIFIKNIFLQWLMQKRHPYMGYLHALGAVIRGSPQYK